MVRANTVTLIKENPAAHGVFDTATETERTVFCTVRSVGMRESYEAMSIGLSVDLVVCLEHDFEYEGEKRLILDNVAYKIVRTYASEVNGIELTCQREEGNAREYIRPNGGSTEGADSSNS